jgi:hypothetical protein
MTYIPDTAPIAEEYGYPQEVATPMGLVARRRMRVLWGDRWEWAYWFLGTGYTYPYIQVNGSGVNNLCWLKKMAIHPPDAMQKTGFLGLGSGGKLVNGLVGPYTQSPVVTDGFGAGPWRFEGTQYVHAIIDLEYSSYGIGANSGNILMEALEPELEVQRIDPAPYSWYGGQPIGQQRPLQFIPGVRYTITYPFANSIAPSVLTLPGYVNSDAFNTYLLGITFPAESLLYLPGPVEVGVNVQGNFKCKYAHHMKFVNRTSSQGGYNGWQCDWNPNTSQFEDYYVSGSPVLRYPETTFTGNI